MTVAESKTEQVGGKNNDAPGQTNTYDPNDPRIDPSMEAPGAPAVIHPLQKLLDHPWWLLFLGLVVPGVSYTAWGWIELWLIGPAQLP